MTNDDPPPSTFFFPLATNTGYFDSPADQLTLLGRIKQASLLYQNIFFESGVLVSSVLETGNTQNYIPAGLCCMNRY